MVILDACRLRKGKAKTMHEDEKEPSSPQALLGSSIHRERLNCLYLRKPLNLIELPKILSDVLIHINKKNNKKTLNIKQECDISDS